uniref:hypothetical protein n=1 Tax=Herbidospora sakaeratensis TaxID=564415 RepID=UPI0007861962|nr:hypothetical protein [Herbidospora sakaeratensis]
MPDYLALYLSHPPIVARLMGQASPGTVLWAHTHELRQLLVAVPSLQEQARTVKLVRAIDARITIERALVSKLEEFAVGIMDDLL